MKKGNILLALAAIILLGGCALKKNKQFDDFTTYFNTYYNANRLLRESESEFSYQDEKKRTNPRVYVPIPSYWQKPDMRKAPVIYMSEFVIDGRKLQPVKTKLDSVIIKGSKILAKHPKSKYVQPTLFMMAQAYFYQSDWINCQVKCSELIDKYPLGDLSPDAHLMIAKTYLIRKKNITGLTILSRCVDIAWIKKRYDILTEAFRLEAELAMFEQRYEDALRPYRQAIAQSNNKRQNARWQVEMASLLYRAGKFDRAAKAFVAVNKFSPDYVTKYESDYYFALCLIQMGRSDDGMKILNKLYKEGKYEEWRDYVVAGRLINYTVTQDSVNYALTEKFADSAYSGSLPIEAAYFMRGIMYYDKKDYENARKYLTQIRNPRSYYYTTAESLSKDLMLWQQKRSAAYTGLFKYSKNDTMSADSKFILANDCFDYGRIHERLGNLDSAIYYYKKATDICPPDSSNRAQFIYGYQRLLRPTNPMLADTLYQILADHYSKTDYGQEAFKNLGYTQYYVIDTVGEIFSSGNQLRQNGIYNMAIDKFLKVYSLYPEHNLAPRAIYSIGWIYENKLNIPDSALFYYNIILSKYPKTEYAKDIQLSVNYLNAKLSGKPIPDSLADRQVITTPKRNYLAEIEESNRQELEEIRRSSSFDKQQSLKIKDKILNAVKEAVKPTLQSINDTKDKATSLKNAVSNLDSAKSLIKTSTPADLLKKDSSKTDSSKSAKPKIPVPTGTSGTNGTGNSGNPEGSKTNGGTTGMLLNNKSENKFLHIFSFLYAQYI